MAEDGDTAGTGAGGEVEGVTVKGSQKRYNGCIQGAFR